MATTFIVDKRSWLNAGIKRTTFINICVITLEIICSTYVDAAFRSARRVINLSASTRRYIDHYIIYEKLSVELISCVSDERGFMKYIQQWNLRDTFVRLIWLNRGLSSISCFVFTFYFVPLLLPIFFSFEYSDNLKWFYGNVKIKFPALYFAIKQRLALYLLSFFLLFHLLAPSSLFNL